MRALSNVKRIVVKVGTSTLTYENGRLNIRGIEKLVRVLADLRNSGHEIVLVSSGAIGVGASKLAFDHRPQEVREKQAAASVGQPLLMEIYDEFFRKYNQTIGQILLTKNVLINQQMHENAVNTFSTLFEYGVIPIVNENDTVVTDEILFGDNDTLSAYIADIVEADLLLLLTDIDGLYDKNPKEFPEAKLLHEVTELTNEVRAAAGGVSSNRGTGGMQTKLLAVEVAAKAGAKTIIMNGAEPAEIYRVLEGEQIGSYFDC